MTVTEFMFELEQAADEAEWTISDDGAIRGVVLAGDSSYRLGPLAVVCFFRTGMMAAEEHWPQAGRALGLSATDCGEIAAAAREQSESKRRRTLRSQLLRSLHLL